MGRPDIYPTLQHYSVSPSILQNGRSKVHFQIDLISIEKLQVRKMVSARAYACRCLKRPGASPAWSIGSTILAQLKGSNGAQVYERKDVGAGGHRQVGRKDGANRDASSNTAMQSNPEEITEKSI